MTPREGSASNQKKKTIRGVLVDLSGTLHRGDEEIPGAKAALQKLRNGRVAVRFLTNTSTQSVARLLDRLNHESTLDFGIAPEELITSLKATAEYVREHDLHPLLLLEDASDFLQDSATQQDTHSCSADTPNNNTTQPPQHYDSVVLGLAPSKFHYEQLNEAFRILLKHPDHLIAVHRSNYVRDASEEALSLGPGAFVQALESASQCSPAKVLGKPSREIFRVALRSMNHPHNATRDESTASDTPISAEEVCMIGDDVVADCQGALEAGIGTAILVQTGKYRSGDEERYKESQSTKSPNDADDEFDENKNRPHRGNLVVRPSIVEAIEFVLESL